MSQSLISLLLFIQYTVVKAVFLKANQTILSNCLKPFDVFPVYGSGKNSHVLRPHLNDFTSNFPNVFGLFFFLLILSNHVGFISQNRSRFSCLGNLAPAFSSAGNIYSLHFSWVTTHCSSCRTQPQYHLVVDAFC